MLEFLRHIRGYLSVFFLGLLIKIIISRLEFLYAIVLLRVRLAADLGKRTGLGHRERGFAVFAEVGVCGCCVYVLLANPPKRHL